MVNLLVVIWLIMGVHIQEDKKKHAYLGGGCFWCIEAVFQDLIGVNNVVSGYAGGAPQKANYNDVSSGNSKHAEICRIEYNPDKILYNQLLEVFFLAHDPTQLNQQGNDIGPQYRSVIFYEDPKEKIAAEEYIQKLLSENVFNNITTIIHPLKQFFKAEEYHQNFFKNNPNQPYCSYIINPKIQLLREKIKNYYIK